VVRGDTTAVDDLLTLLLPRLLRRLRRVPPGIDPHVLAEAAEDAALDYIAHPGVFDPARGTPLDGFLFQAAWRNVQNVMRADASRRERETHYARGLELTRSSRAGAQQRLRLGISLMLAGAANESERQAVRLLLRGERRTLLYAVALGLCHLPVAEQARQVKRFKDRILAYARRRIKKLGS
jgi:hypothetical protein